ncbi:MAG: dihydroorotate dehydrogenase [Sphaerochaetaceae bacterium]|nr:dihydroorotate dehydrogenase [Sphaerochaetaceae bacterium]
MTHNDLLAQLSGLHKRVVAGDERPQLASVSGVVTTSLPMIKYFDKSLTPFTMVTTKSFQISPNPGNREPIICEVESGSFGNSVGLRNQGMESALEELRLLREHPMRTLLNISLSASTIKDFVILAKAFEPLADILELNFSCPHAAEGYGSAIGCSAQISAAYVAAIREALGECRPLIFPKLTPNVTNIGAIAQEVMAAGADGLVAINTVGPEVHIEPISGLPILQNSLGGAGGKSGKWIYQEALKAVKAIRQAVGEEVPLIGMGGVSNGRDVAEMVLAGSDLVGIGSAFAKVHQREWPAYAEALVDDASAILRGEERNNSAKYYSLKPSMEYKERKVIERQEFGSDTLVVTLEGNWPFEAGEYVFLWIPGVGEKPFSIAIDSPLTFVIKLKGAFTKALFNLKVGDSLFIRGLYGEPFTLPSYPKATLVAGGSGVAVVPPLAKRLTKEGVTLQTFVGISDENQRDVLRDEIEKYGPLNIVADQGEVGRVLSEVVRGAEVEGCSYYFIGPTPFMGRGAKELVERGVSPRAIFLSLELPTLCGVGLCGQCSCGERLTCQYGTFVSYHYVLENDEELLR